MIRVELYHKHLYVEVLTTHTLECELIWAYCFCRCNYLNWDEVILEWGGLSIQPDWHAYKRMPGDQTNTHTEKVPCEGEGRDEGDVSTGQETPSLANKTPEARQ